MRLSTGKLALPLLMWLCIKVLHGAGVEPVLVEFFYNPGCDECEVVKQEILPALHQTFGDAIRLEEYDLLEKTHYGYLVQLQERLGVRTSEPVSIYIDGTIHLGGLASIQQQLTNTIAQLRAGTIAGARSPPPRPVPPPEAILAKRMRSYSVGLIVGAGLADGFNPCAFSTIVFFITLLSAYGCRQRDLALVGLTFCATVFLTYLLIGLGAFHIIQKLAAYTLAGLILKWLMVTLLALLALLSFRDAWVFAQHRAAQKVLLQLPDSIKQRIHQVLRTNLTARGLITGSLVSGFLVTLLESACTGQLYGPTLAALALHPELGRLATPLLLLYNFMFIVPLVLVFLTAVAGIHNARLLDWSRHNVAWSKTFLGLLFVTMLLLLLLW